MRAILSIPLLLSGTAVWAQTLEEVVVTAERREVGVQDVPIAITALTSEHIKDLNLQETRDIATQTPNLVVEELFGRTSPTYVLRGVSNSDFTPTASTPLAIYADGVALVSPVAQGFAMFDLERIEVLRGPQGTLYGRNSTSGSMNFISRKPGDRFEANGSVTVGDYGKVRAELGLGGPIAEGVKGRLAVLRNESDGYVKNVINGAHMPKGEDLAVRGILELTPGGALSIMIKAQYGEMDGETYPYLSSIRTFPIIPGWSDTPFDNPMPGSEYERAALDLTDRPERVYTKDFAVQADWDLGSMVLTSLTGYDANSRWEKNDIDSSPFPLLHENVNQEQHQISQELRLTSTTDSRLQWIAGLFYLHENVDSPQTYDLSALFEDQDTNNGYGGAIRFKQKLDSYAAFVHTTYALTDKLGLTLAARYTKDEKEVDGITNSCIPFDRRTTLYTQLTPDMPNICDNAGVQQRQDEWSQVTWRAALDYALSDDVKVYGSISRGFKGGGYNGIPVSRVDLSVAKPEQITAYELGAKSDLLDRRMRLNGAVFYYDYRDYQLVGEVFSDESPTGVANALTNASKTRLYGGEIELQANLIERLTTSLTYGYVKAEFVDYVEASGIDHKGEVPGRIPKTFTYRLQYEIPVGNVWTLTPQLDGIWRSSTVGTRAAGFIKVDSYWVPNARLTLRNSNTRFFATLFAEGIDREQHKVTQTLPRYLPFATTDFIGLSPKPTYGLTLGMSW